MPIRNALVGGVLRSPLHRTMGRSRLLLFDAAGQESGAIGSGPGDAPGQQQRGVSFGAPDRVCPDSAGVPA